MVVPAPIIVVDPAVVSSKDDLDFELNIIVWFFEKFKFYLISTIFNFWYA